MMRRYLPFGARKKKFAWMWLGLELGLLMGLLLWWWLQDQPLQRKSKPTPPVILPPDADSAPAPVRPTKASVPAPIPDDLTRINGIGPKYAQILAAAGVVTYQQLAAQPPEQLVEILRAATGRAPGVAAWIEQAASRTLNR